jgi:ferrous iron transport protein B
VREGNGISAEGDFGIAELEARVASAERDRAVAELEMRRTQESLEKSYLGRTAIAITPVFEPLGFGWKDTVAILTGFVAKEVVVASYAVLYSQEESATEVSVGLRQALAANMTPAVALAFMVFVLLYSPCLSTIAVIRREAEGWRWAGFSVAFSLALAWGLAFGINTIGGMIT